VTLDPDAFDAAATSRGDLAAFERLYRRHVARVHGLARWLLGGEEPDDAVQEVFLRLWLKARLYDPAVPFVAWFGRLAINVILNWRGRHRRHQLREDGTDAWAVDSAVAHTVDAGTVASMLDLEAAVPRLPTGARDVFILFDVQGFSHDEIAEALGISVGTSRSQLHRARSLLRQHLTPKETLS
jgi:RNA polymerase sigma-70 factor (ECF subfamily)